MAETNWPPKRDRITWAWQFYGDNKDSPKRVKWTVGKRPGWVLSMPGFNDALMRKGDRFIMPLARTTSYPLIGAVALHWGDFEIAMDKLLASFVAADADPNDIGWDRRGFAVRKKLLVVKAAVHFPGLISDEIIRILKAAAAYHWQRNLVVHGHFVAKADKGVVTTIAQGRVHKRDVAMAVTDEHLERMYHEISFLAGRLSDLTSADRKAGRSWLSWKDRSRLRAFVKKHPPSLPTFGKIPPQHPPLRVLSILHRKRRPDRGWVI
jgi:hypothetical protein